MSKSSNNICDFFFIVVILAKYPKKEGFVVKQIAFFMNSYNIISFSTKNVA